MTSSTWQTIKFECFLGFGMWSVPPYCETKDLMNRIRKIHFKRHNSNIEDEEFDNYMTIWKVPCYFFGLKYNFYVVGMRKTRDFKVSNMMNTGHLYIFFFAFKSFESILSSFFLRQTRNSFEIFSSWLCIIRAMNLFKEHTINKRS